MLPVVECEGAPRDVGQDQGRALAREIRRSIGAAPGGRLGRALAALRPTRGVARDLERYFPHLAERAAGLAEGAGVDRARVLARCMPPAWGSTAATRVSVGLGMRPGAGTEGPCLAGALPLPADAAPVLRRARPQGGMASLELGLTWWVGALAGVNAGGLAALALAAEPGSGAADASAEAPLPCRAPAALLVTQCLERFERVGAALEWCLRRPAAGPAALLFADAQGELAGLVLQRAGRQVIRDEAGILVLGAPEPRRALLEREARLGGRLSLARIGALFATEDEPPGSGQRVVILLPARRRLGLPGAEAGRPAPVWHEV